MLIQHAHQLLIIIEDIQQFLQQGVILLAAIFHPVLDASSYDLNDFLGFDLVKVEDGHVHPTLSAFLQLIYKGDIPGEQENGDVLLHIGVVQPFEDIVQDALLPTM